MKNHSIIAALFCALVLLVQPHAVTAATGIKEIQGLMADGKLDRALRLTNEALQENADDVNYQFVKGLILIRMKQLKQAEDIFIHITEEHPELPEPYNNLAVIYAATGDLDKARDALQEAINTHPSYATAHENIGDIYAKLASRAYNQALELDRENKTAEAKLALINDLFSAPRPAPTVLAQAAEPKPAAAPKTEPEPEPEPAAAPAETGTPQPEPAPAASAPAAEPSPPAGKQEADTAAQQQAIVRAVRQTVNDWASAWSSQDVPAYLSFYDKEFTPPAGQSRANWEKERRDRVSSPGFIKVKISDLKVQPLGREHAQATFIQKYQSDTYGDLVTKLLLLVKRGDDWRIVQEATK